MAKESIYSLDKRVIFRETFNSESATRSNGGTPTSVTYSKGTGSFNGSTSNIDYSKQLSGVYSIRCILNVLDETQYIFDAKGVGTSDIGHAYINNTVGSLSITSGTRYVNGVSKASITFGVKQEILIAGITLSTLNENLFSLGNSAANNAALNGSVELFEIYKGTLTANEVALLYENSIYIEPVFANEILSIDSRNGGIVDKWSNTLTNTSVSIVNDESIYTQKYNGSSSKLDCGSDLIGVGNITAMAWIKPFSFGEADAGRILDNGKFYFLISDTDDKLNLFSDGATQTASAANSIIKNKYSFVAVTRTSSGTANFYVNGILSGSADLNSGTPVAGSTNLIVGNNNAQTRTFNGNIPIVKVISGILTTKQIEQYFNATRRYFNV